jgi:hypothetical protein
VQRGSGSESGQRVTASPRTVARMNLDHHRRLTEAGVRTSAVDDERPGEDYVSFRCWDPDGTEIEVFWET